MPAQQGRSARRLTSGGRIHLGRNRDLFDAVPKRGVYRRTEQGLLEPFEAGLARIVAASIGGADEDTVTLFDLGGIVEADPRELVAGLREGIRTAKPAGSPRGGPPRAAGRRYVALGWRTSREREAVLRASVESLWELEDRRRLSDRLPIPLITEAGVRLLGHLPARLGGARLERIIDTAVVTYHTLVVAPGEPGNSPKAAGRELLRYERLGLVVRREYPSSAELETLGVPAHPSGQARPRFWESVPAAVRFLFPR